MGNGLGWTGALLAALPLAASAAGVQGPKDVGVFPGYELAQDSSKQFEFEFFEFPVDVPGKDYEEKRVEGRKWELRYELKEGRRAPSALEVIRNYQNAFKKAGGSVLYTHGDGDITTLQRRLPSGADLWVHVHWTNHGGTILINAVETAAMKQSLEFTAAQMGEALRSKGRIALRGILFDTGKWAIKPESQELLAEVASLLDSDPALSLVIEGHTDSEGGAAHNLKLSQRRAAAVSGLLVSRGIAPERLAGAGFGDTKPVADNATDSGRAKNRRVELVKR